MRRLRQRNGEVNGDVDLRTVGDTTILRWRAGDGHELLRGGALTLPMLWHRFGSIFTARELLFFYLCCPTVVGTRAHAWGSKDVKAAARARKQIYGHWGHMKTAKRKGP